MAFARVPEGTNRCTVCAGDGIDEENDRACAVCAGTGYYPPFDHADVPDHIVVQRMREGQWVEVSVPDTLPQAIAHAKRESGWTLDKALTRILVNGEEVARYRHDPRKKSKAAKVMPGRI